MTTNYHRKYKMWKYRHFHFCWSQRTCISLSVHQSDTKEIFSEVAAKHMQERGLNYIYGISIIKYI